MKKETIEKLDKFNVIELYNNGKTLLEIQNIVGYTSVTISKYLKLHNVNLRKAAKRESLREVPVRGAKFGQYTVISDKVKVGSELSGSEIRQLYWEVQCECGKMC